MYCTHCGKELPEGACLCPYCNTPVPGPTGNPTYYYGENNPVTPGMPNYTPVKLPVGWFVTCIVLTVLSGFSNILALIGAVFGGIAQYDFSTGRVVEAKQNNKICRTLGILSVTLGIVGSLLILFSIFFLIFGAAEFAPYMDTFENLIFVSGLF